MRVLRAAIGLAGVAICAGGAATILTPELAAAVPVDDAVSRLGNDYLLVAVIGVAGAVATVVMLGRQSVRGVVQATPPDPEGPPTGRRPGAQFDAAIDSGRGLGLWLRPGRRKRVRDRLFRAAVEALMRTTDCSRGDARRQVEQGTWTEDREAAAFLGDDVGINPITRLAAALRGEAPIRRRIRRTVSAIDGLDGGDRE